MTWFENSRARISLRAAAVGLLALALAGGDLWAATELTADQAKALQTARSYALAYTNRLPNFICSQVTERTRFAQQISASIVGRGAAAGWIPLAGTAGTDDHIVERLTFFNHQENYEVVTVNDHAARGVKHLDLGGAMSEGEFGTALGEIFAPSTGTDFTWHGMDSIRGRSAYVFSYRVPKEFGIMVGGTKQDQAQVSYQGLAYVDAVNGEVLRITTTLDLPAGFSIDVAERSVDYKPVTIAGSSYTLPWHSVMQIESAGMIFVNKIEFKDYRVFRAESKIHYDDGTVETPR
jgi:hypothetical protein